MNYEDYMYELQVYGLLWRNNILIMELLRGTGSNSVRITQVNIEWSWKAWNSVEHFWKILKMYSVSYGEKHQVNESI